MTDSDKIKMESRISALEGQYDQIQAERSFRHLVDGLSLDALILAGEHIMRRIREWQERRAGL